MDTPQDTPSDLRNLIKQIVALGLSYPEADLNTTQLAQAQALRQPDYTFAHTPWGAGLGGAANAINDIRGSLQQQRLNQAQRTLLANRAPGLEAALTHRQGLDDAEQKLLMAAILRQQQAPQAAQSAQPQADLGPTAPPRIGW